MLESEPQAVYREKKKEKYAQLEIECRWFKPQRRHCVVALSKTLYPLQVPIQYSERSDKIGWDANTCIILLFSYFAWEIH